MEAAMTANVRQLSFRPRARLITILGHDLIGDQTIGLLELVKNAYDADASQVRVELLDLLDPARATITVCDDGCGMSVEDVETRWLSPATDVKERAKQARSRTPRGRLPIGEKGVGRFAVHKLGRRLQLVTRTAGGPELVLDIDWDSFDNGDRYLDDLKLTVMERVPEVFTSTNTGTLLRISRLRDPWTETEVKKLQRALRRLQSPHREWRDFSITLRCPDFLQYENLDTGDILERAHYVFRGLVDQEGILDYEYICRLPGVPARTVTQDKYNLVPMARAELTGDAPQCGSFYINLYVWDRTRDLLNAAGVSREDLDAHCGVSVFRDGLRVLPYGEPGDDWLQLDRERINDPSGRVGNNQVIGYVEIDQEQTVQLRDKTNREGLIDNPAFRDLRALVRAAIMVFTSHWREDRPRDNAGASTERSPRARPVRLDAARTIAAAIAESASNDVPVRLPSDVLPSDTPASDVHRAAGTGQPRGGDTAHDDSDTAPATVSQRTAARILVSELDEAAQAVRDQARSKEEEDSILLHLAATGMAAERVVHEFSRQVTAALKAAEELRTLHGLQGQAAQALKTVEACLGTLRNEFRVLAPYEGPVRAQRTTLVDMRNAAELAVELNRHLIDQQDIKVQILGEGFAVRARPASVVQVLDNLVNNACYWLGAWNPQTRPEIQITLDSPSRTVTVTDNGPGVPEHARRQLFQPFFTLRNGGRGLGLYISRELLRQMNATICLADPQPAAETSPGEGRGACFVIIFPADE
jgi:signal transduction histidine kinase